LRASGKNMRVKKKERLRVIWATCSNRLEREGGRKKRDGSGGE